MVFIRFYQRHWDLVGNSVLKYLLDFFESQTIPSPLNDTLLCLNFLNSKTLINYEKKSPYKGM